MLFFGSCVSNHYELKKKKSYQIRRLNTTLTSKCGCKKPKTKQKKNTESEEHVSVFDAVCR